VNETEPGTPFLLDAIIYQIRAEFPEAVANTTLAQPTDPEAHSTAVSQPERES
jgi:hypothetical protein